jgi:hypothetical protein
MRRKINSTTWVKLDTVTANAAEILILLRAYIPQEPRDLEEVLFYKAQPEDPEIWWYE